MLEALMRPLLWLGIGTISALAGCMQRAPTQALEEAAAAFRAAEELDASKEPSASLHLQLAREQGDLAKNLIADHQYVRAERLLQRAEADATLAVALARTHKEDADAAAAVARVKELRGLNGGKRGEQP
jgi:hypothetical protein